MTMPSPPKPDARSRFDSYPLPDWLQSCVERNIGRVPRWRFHDLPASPTLTYQRLTFDNRHVVLAMFGDDPDPFVDPHFKEPAGLYEYVAQLRINGPYSPKHGGCDWIAYRGKTPAGLLHAYDISCETWALNHRHCTIGYIVAPPFRGTGLAQEAVRTLHAYLFERRDMLMLLAYPKRENERSLRFLRGLGYEERAECDHDREGDPNRYFELYRSARARQLFLKRFDSIQKRLAAAGETVPKIVADLES